MSVATNFNAKLLNRAARAKSFAVQFTSCMLLILTFIIGSYSRPKKDLVPEVDQKVPRFERRQIGQMEFADLFVAGEGSMNPEKVAALTSVLTQHDLEVEVNLYGADEDRLRAADERAILAMSRAATLTRKLYKSNVPRAAIKVFANADESALQARITFFRVHDNGI